MHPRKIQIRALRGSDSEQWGVWRGVRWIWLCHQCHTGFPCANWETAMDWVDYHIKKVHREM